MSEFLSNITFSTSTILNIVFSNIDSDVCLITV
jgi:hypothetical protein